MSGATFQQLLGGSGVVQASFISQGQFTNGTNTSSISLAGQTLAVGKLLFACLVFGTGTSPVLTVNGVTATLVASDIAVSSRNLSYYSVDCSVSSGTVSVSVTGNMVHLAFSCWKIIGSYQSATASTASGSAGSASASISAPANSAVIGFGVGEANNSSFTSAWTGATKDTVDTTFGEIPTFHTQSATHANQASAATVGLTIAFTVSTVWAHFLLLSP